MTKTETKKLISELQLSNISIITPHFVYKTKPTLKITCSKDTFELLLQNWNMNTIDLREELCLILLNRSLFVIGIYWVTIGTATGTVIDIHKILAISLLVNANAIITIHNHPSGNIQPSEPDKTHSNQLKDACKIMQLDYLDNMIITRNSYFSFSDEHLI